MDIETSNVVQRNKLLLYGYCRLHLGSEIPTDLMLLLKSFCENVIAWRFTNGELHGFREASVMESQIYSFGDFKLQIQLHPNGDSDKTEGYVQFYLCVLQMPESVEYVALQYELLCDATLCSSKGTMRFSFNGQHVKWHKRSLQLSQLRHKESVKFEAFVDIQFVQCKQQQNGDKAEQVQKQLSNKHSIKQPVVIDELMYFRKMKMRRIIEKTWRFSKDRKLYVPDHGHYYVSNFSFGCWTLYVSKKDGFCIGIVLLGLPFRIRALECDYIVKVTQREQGFIRKKGNKYFSYQAAPFSRLQIEFEGKVKPERVQSINIEIRIRKMHDLHYKKVPRDQWNKYLLQ